MRTECDAETRFHAIVAEGSAESGLELLKKLDTHFADSEKNMGSH